MSFKVMEAGPLMAKKVSPRPGALSEMLKLKEMTQQEASNRTGVDRKTLRRIDRGAEVKEKTIEDLARRMGVRTDAFGLSTTDQNDGSPQADRPSQILTLRQLNVERLVLLISEAHDIHWNLNVPVLDGGVRGLLEDFERVVMQYKERCRFPAQRKSLQETNLKYQLDDQKKAEELRTLLKRLAEHRLNLLGADYLSWVYRGSDPFGETPDLWTQPRILLLSIDRMIRIRDVEVWVGVEPPAKVRAYWNQLWIDYNND
jgi:transcriptional regulator with XRE-family HTH domain